MCHVGPIKNHLYIRKEYLKLYNCVQKIITIIIVIIIFTSWEFFTSVLADGLSLEFEWQQVSSNLQDCSQYSGRSQ